MAPSLAVISPDHSADVNQFNILLSYLDNIPPAPPTLYRLFPFVEWMRLPYVLIIIPKLASNNASYAATH